MTKAFDQHAINDMTTALGCEMSTSGRRPHQDGDTLFIGGTAPTDRDEIALGQFGFSKNYKIVYASYDLSDVLAGPADYHVVVTDGLTQSYVLPNGRLWKRDRRTPSVLVFDAIRATVSLSAKGRLVVRGTRGHCHDHGYVLAREALATRAASKPGRAPVVSPIGGLVTVLDVRSLSETFEKAA